MTQVSGPDTFRRHNAKRARSAKEVPDLGEALTSQLVPEVPTAKRSRHSPASTTSSIAVLPLKKKNTARKSTQHISSGRSSVLFELRFELIIAAQRLRWEAGIPDSTADAVEDSEWSCVPVTGC